MVKRATIIFSLFLTSLFIFNWANDSETRHFFSTRVGSARLDQVLTLIQQLPEARQLIKKIEQEGPIKICAASSDLSNKFGAYWDPDKRLICVNCSSSRSDGALIGSILFELHNAIISKKLDDLAYLATKLKIDRWSYVRAIEKLEYQNSLLAAAMAEKGISSGLFPQSSRLMTYSCFEEHYYFQRVGGHSAWIANTYDRIAGKRLHWSQGI